MQCMYSDKPILASSYIYISISGQNGKQLGMLIPNYRNVKDTTSNDNYMTYKTSFSCN